MLLEGRDVGVAKNGKAIRTKLDASPDGIETGGDRLIGQSVDQIEVDAGDAGSPQACRRIGGLLEALHPIDGALDHGIEALHAKACPVDAGNAQARRSSGRVSVRGSISTAISADGKHKEGLPDRPDQIHEQFRRHDRRRAAAKVDMIDLHAAFDLPRLPDRVRSAAPRHRPQWARRGEPPRCDSRNTSTSTGRTGHADRAKRWRPAGSPSAIRRRSPGRWRPRNAGRSDSSYISVNAPVRSRRQDLASFRIRLPIE